MCEASYLRPHSPQQSFDAHLKQHQQQLLTVRNIEIVQPIFGTIDSIGAIYRIFMLTAAQSGIVNAPIENFWNWMVGTQ